MGRKTKAVTFEKNGKIYRVCVDCNNEYLLSELNFQLRKNEGTNRDKKYYTGKCLSCLSKAGSKRSKISYEKLRKENPVAFEKRK